MPMRTFAAGLAAITLCGASWAQTAADLDPEIEATAKSAKMHGPDLSGFVTEDVARMIAYLRQEEAPDGKRHRRRAKAPDDELTVLLDWLASLEAPIAKSAGDGR